MDVKEFASTSDINGEAVSSTPFDDASTSWPTIAPYRGKSTMFRTLTASLVGCAALAMLVVLPLRNAIRIDAQGRPLTTREVPPLPAWHAIYRDQWWRDPERIRIIRRMYAELSDEEFLRNYHPQSEAAQKIREALGIPRPAEPARPNDHTPSPTADSADEQR